MKNKMIKIPEIEKIQIRDFEVIEKADINFSKGLNIIVGGNGTGKSTVINYLIKISDPNIMAVGNRIMFDIHNEINKTCILVDDELGRLDHEKMTRILKDLETCNRQVIATLYPDQLESVNGKVKANIINTKEFELKK